MKWVAGFCVWLVLVLGAAGFVVAKDGSYLGGGFAAKEICSCMVLGERDFEACRADLMPVAGLSWLETAPLADGTGVRSGLPGFTPRVARGKPDLGCTLEP